MIYEWLMVICLYAYVASSLSKALPLWRLRRRATLGRAPYVRVVEWAACRGEATSPSGTPTAVAPPLPPAAPVVTPSSSSSALAAFMAAVPQPKGPSAETAPRPTSRLAEFVAAVPSR